jgi:hypothetical protein
LFSWLSELVRRTWDEKNLLSPRIQSAQATFPRTADHEWVDRQTNVDHAIDIRRRPSGREAPVGNQPDAPGCSRADQPRPQSAKSIVKKRGGPKPIDQAIVFLCRELADGEVAATLLEDRAKAIGISPRTLDRARARLKVISRRTGFAKDGKCWLSLPRASKRRRLGRQKRKKRETHVARCRQRQLVGDPSLLKAVTPK